MATWIWRLKKRAAKIMEMTRAAVTALQERVAPLQQLLFYCVFACG
ncbi:hypothetical protein [Moorella sp. Hama-1]|nr:hypothetical protein [Moorella sp. Hama-1]